MTFRTERLIPFGPEVVYEAFAQREVLARWWGPNGFSNTFELFEFQAGGRWKFVMNGPNGAQFPNESTFREVSASTIVIQHLSKPHYVLTIRLTGQQGGTLVMWNQEFADANVAARIRHIVEPANEQNLDRLDRKSTRLNSSHVSESRMPSSA